MAGATCHTPGFSCSDALPKAIGQGMTELGRKTPTILNVAWAELLFWDGRAESLEEQALGPIASPREMNQDLDKMVQTVSGFSDYRELLARAYPGDEVAAKTLA